MRSVLVQTTLILGESTFLQYRKLAQPYTEGIDVASMRQLQLTRSTPNVNIVFIQV